MKEALFEADYAWAECLWGRAMLPMGLGRYKQNCTFAEDVAVRQTQNFENMAQTSSVFASDGSGGPQ